MGKILKKFSNRIQMFEFLKIFIKKSSTLEFFNLAVFPHPTTADLHKQLRIPVRGLIKLFEFTKSSTFMR